MHLMVDTVTKAMNLSDTFFLNSYVACCCCFAPVQCWLHTQWVRDSDFFFVINKIYHKIRRENFNFWILICSYQKWENGKWEWIWRKKSFQRRDEKTKTKQNEFFYMSIKNNFYKEMQKNPLPFFCTNFDLCIYFDCCILRCRIAF